MPMLQIQKRIPWQRWTEEGQENNRYPGRQGAQWDCIFARIIGIVYSMRRMLSSPYKKFIFVSEVEES